MGDPVIPWDALKALRVKVTAGSSQTRILKYDPQSNTANIAVAAPAEDNRANMELLKFLKRLTERNVSIKTGHTSRIKLIRLE